MIGESNEWPLLIKAFDIVVSASGSEISTSQGDIYGQWNFGTRSTLTDPAILSRMYVFVKCNEVQKSLCRNQKQVRLCTTQTYRTSWVLHHYRTFRPTHQDIYKYNIKSWTQCKTVPNQYNRKCYKLQLHYSFVVELNFQDIDLRWSVRSADSAGFLFAV